MFENLNWWEIGALILLALLIFGDRLPQVIQDGLRLIRNLRNMARDATSDLSRELGTDIQLEDLHPKAFIRKHLLSEEDEAALRNPIQGLVDSVKRDVSGLNNEFKDVGAALDPRRSDPAPAAAPSSPAAPAAAPANKPAAFDLDAT